MFLIVILLNGIIIFYACKKDKETEPVEFDTHTSEDNALAEGTFNDVNNMCFQAMENGQLTTYRLSEKQNSILSVCATVTAVPDSSGNGGTITIDFGTSNCQCVDGRYRRGVINVTYTGAYRDSGTVISTTFNNYYVGKDTGHMFNVSGSKSVTNNGHNAAGHLNYTIAVNGQLTNANNEVMNWTSTRNREWIAGEGTHANWTDDEYLITGNASGNNFEQNSFTVTITQPLKIALNCRWIKSGTFDLTPSGKPTRTFDYGNGDCDYNASLTVNGRTIPIILY